MTLDEFIALLKTEFEIDDAKVVEGSDALYGLFGDSSLNLLFLRGIVDNHLGVSITDSEIKSCVSVSDLHSKIMEKVGH